MKPTVGRILWYFPHAPHPQTTADHVPRAAIIAYVENDHMVNLMVIDTNGMTYSRQNVDLLDEGAGHPWPNRDEHAAEHGESELRSRRPSRISSDR